MAGLSVLGDFFYDPKMAMGIKACSIRFRCCFRAWLFFFHIHCVLLHINFRLLLLLFRVWVFSGHGRRERGTRRRPYRVRTWVGGNYYLMQMAACCWYHGMLTDSNDNDPGLAGLSVAKPCYLVLYTYCEMGAASSGACLCFLDSGCGRPRSARGHYPSCAHGST